MKLSKRIVFTCFSNFFFSLLLFLYSMSAYWANKADVRRGGDWSFNLYISFTKLFATLNYNCRLTLILIFALIMHQIYISISAATATDNHSYWCKKKRVKGGLFNINVCVCVCIDQSKIWEIRINKLSEKKSKQINR